MRERQAMLPVLGLILAYRIVNCDNCLTTQNDTGALYIRQMQEAIEEAVCELKGNTSYKDYSPEDGEEFDFIVVGAGSAGAVVANRLSANPSWRVLLLEAGGDPTLTTEIPRLRKSTWTGETSWNYVTEPDPLNCLGSQDGRCSLPRGKVLGGSSSINGMLYLRGHPEDYDGWERMGNPGWGFRDMLPYFRKSEDIRVESVLNTPDALAYHGVGGLLKVESYRHDYDIIAKTVSTGYQQLGYDINNDYNSQFGDGLFPIQATLEDARRCSTAKAFLLDFQERLNLKISKHSLVVKILIDENNSTYGVAFVKDGMIFQVNATKEVILSAGAVNSPQVLMLSGVGPQDHIQQFGINVKQNLKVGYNLQDHPAFTGFLITTDMVEPPKDFLNSLFEFLVTKNGNLTTLDSLSDTSFITSSGESYRNVQIFFSVYGITNPPAADRNFFAEYGFEEDVQKSINSITSKKLTFSTVPSVLRPKSRGRILLKSGNPQEPPSIYPGYFHDDVDVKVLLEAIVFMNELVQTESFQRMGCKVARVDIPACRDFEFQSEEYWRCSIKYLVMTTHHLAGSCRMGPREAEDSVVDPELRVIGVDKLRVVDASIMPSLVSGNTNAATIAIGEKGADLIKQAWIHSS